MIANVKTTMANTKTTMVIKIAGNLSASLTIAGEYSRMANEWQGIADNRRRVAGNGPESKGMSGK
jgi:hypothetical protein